jgi:hypothetical protein
MTNNPRKIVGLDGYGLTVTEQVPLEIEACATNYDYLRTKKLRMAHTLTVGDTRPAPDANASRPSAGDAAGRA